LILSELLFGTNCDGVITRMGVGIIFTINESVDRIKNFKSHASPFKENLYGKNAPLARFFMKQNAPQARYFD
jgi:hypothetical protein